MFQLMNLIFHIYCSLRGLSAKWWKLKSSGVSRTTRINWKISKTYKLARLQELWIITTIDWSPLRFIFHWFCYLARLWVWNTFQLILVNLLYFGTGNFGLSNNTENFISSSTDMPYQVYKYYYFFVVLLVSQLIS